MTCNFLKTVSAVSLPLIAVNSVLSADQDSKGSCAPAPAVTCNEEACCRTYCVGPENYGVNAPVRPRLCNGDWVVSIAGFYWNTHQDGMEYAVNNNVSNPRELLPRLVEAKYENPNFHWDFGFKLGFAYNTTCDGWDIGVNWIHYKGNASSEVEAEPMDNSSLFPLWSIFLGQEPQIGPDPASVISPTFATDIETHWGLQMNVIDIELGREFWTSKKVALRPHAGLRIARLDQDYEIAHKGGVFSEGRFRLEPLNDRVKTKNDFKGVGVRAGLNSTWNLGCGWAIYNDLALSIIYGKFNIEQDEFIHQSVSPFDKTKISQIEESFRVSRLSTDLALGVQWSSLFCDCKYGVTVKLGWEHHLFLDQNQMWRVTQLLGSDGALFVSSQAYNVYQQRRGNLDTQGWTLSAQFSF